MLKPLAGAVAALAFIFAATARAAPADDAKAHFQAIAGGDVATLGAGYADGATLLWIGGPLDGGYTGADAIRATWQKFAAAQGPLKLTVEHVEEAANPKVATVTANLLFEGKAPIRVRHVLVYRDGRIAGEVWQIAPALAIGAGY